MRRLSPWNAVTPSANQHSEPALSPVITTPASQAARSIRSIPCAIHVPSSEITLPPPTYTRSWLSRWAPRSAAPPSRRNSETCDGWQRPAGKAR